MSDRKRTGLTIRNSTAEFLIFTRQAGEAGIRVRHEDETIWLTQKLVAELFGVTVPTVNEHLKNIFNSGELDEQAVVRKFRTTAADGKSYQTQHYNLDAIISVGYRVNSVRATPCTETRPDAEAAHRPVARARIGGPVRIWQPLRRETDAYRFRTGRTMGPRGLPFAHPGRPRIQVHG